MAKSLMDGAGTCSMPIASVSQVHWQEVISITKKPKKLSAAVVRKRPVIAPCPLRVSDNSLISLMHVLPGSRISNAPRKRRTPSSRIDGTDVANNWPQGICLRFLSSHLRNVNSTDPPSNGAASAVWRVSSWRIRQHH